MNVRTPECVTITTQFLIYLFTTALSCLLPLMITGNKSTPHISPSLHFILFITIMNIRATRTAVGPKSPMPVRSLCSKSKMDFGPMGHNATTTSSEMKWHPAGETISVLYIIRYIQHRVPLLQIVQRWPGGIFTLFSIRFSWSVRQANVSYFVVLCESYIVAWSNYSSTERRKCTWEMSHLRRQQMSLGF